MQVAAGTRLGPYEIIAPIAAGGMGEIWRARDTRLGRNVAIKILPAEFAQDERSRLRFQREAHAISQLNHPHICTLLDAGEEYIVMELVEGSNLATRLERGPLPLREVLRCGAEIADALATAHRAGIIHRDLKPANVMLTKSGAKLLDFGIARTTFADANRATEKQLTTAGTVLGTLHYMAPEQLAGAESDARTDIFALGVLLFEMATGRPAFDGTSRVAVITSIVNDQPPALEPPAFEHVVRKCLAKDPDERWQSAFDVAEELRWCGESLGVTGGKRPSARSWPAWSVAALMTIVAAVLASMLMRGRQASSPSVAVSAINVPEGAEFSPVAGGAAGFRAIAVSPDGTQIAFSAQLPGRKPQLWLRSLAAEEAVPLPGTEGAVYPFWSPDSRWIGFFADGKLRKIPTAGGPPIEICDAPDARGGTWNNRGTILFGSVRAPLQRVSAEGGIPTQATTLTGSQQSHRWPWFLADGERFIFLGSSTSTNTMHDDDALFGQSPGISTPVPLVKASSNAAVVSGWLLYGSGSNLVARAIDEKTLAVGASAVVLARKVHYSGAAGLAAFAAADDVLAYATASQTVIRWLARDRTESVAFPDPGEYTGFLRLCCNDTRVLTAIIDPAHGSTDLWALDLARGGKTRLTFSEGNEGNPVWSPDGERIFYTYRDRVVAKSVSDPAAKETVVFTRADAAAVPFSISPDGALLALHVVDRGQRSGGDIWIVPLAGDRRPFAFIDTPFSETGPQFSPDGKFLAYTSNESGKNEVYLTTFPSRAKRWQVSAGDVNGIPVWRRDGRELFYVSSDRRRLLHVPVTFAGSEARFGAPSPLFDLPPLAEHVTIGSDGTRLLVSERPERPGASPLILMQNWRARLPRD